MLEVDVRIQPTEHQSATGRRTEEPWLPQRYASCLPKATPQITVLQAGKILNDFDLIRTSAGETDWLAWCPDPEIAAGLPMNDLDRALLKRLRDRDERAFRELIDAHRDRVFGISYRMLGNRAEAEDVAQEVFIAVFKTIDSFREESKFSTWLYRVTVNHCKNRLKYLSRRRDRDRDELDETTLGSVAAGELTAGPVAPDRALHGSQMEKLLEEAIASLDEEHRVVVVLRDIEELSMEEICDITGLPDGTVKSRIHRGRLALRKKLQRHV